RHGGRGSGDPRPPGGCRTSPSAAGPETRRHPVSAWSLGQRRPQRPWGSLGRRHRGTSGRMFSRARTFLRIGDIPVRADASWLVVLALLTWSFWSRFNLTYPAGTALVIAVIAAAVFSLSVIAHEI